MNNFIRQNANVGNNCKFGEGVIIGKNVKIGDNNVFGNYVVIEGNVEIGSSNYFSDMISIGRPSCHQIMKYEFLEPQGGKIVIGDNNVFREFTSFNLPTRKTTTIGNGCYLMPYCHVTHDAVISDGVVFANNVQTGGHTFVGKNTFLGFSVSTHQVSAIGAFCMIGMQSCIIKDIPPGMLAFGNPIRCLQVDKVGLLKKGFKEKDVEEIIRFYEESKTRVDAEKNLSVVSSDLFRKNFSEFLNHSKRSIALPKNRIWKI